MKVLPAFFRLIRWPNLFFIALTQVLFRFFILRFVFINSPSGSQSARLSLPLFYLLVFASVSIAAAGYIINDYFDVNIDLVNKPAKLIIDRHIKRRWAIVLHIIFSFLGFVISCYVGYKLRNLYIPAFNLLAVISLWFYSTTFKKKLLIGNVLISLLTAWVILILTVSEHKLSISPHDIYWQRLLKLSFVYAGFAFIISLIREVIKDMEDMRGDVKYGCKTMPIVWGLQVSKVFVAVWIIVIIGAVAALQIYVIQLGWWFSALYSCVTIILPLLYVLSKLYVAHTKKEFHHLSTLVKLIMLSGILSMIFF
jgi:4-hydroxybenzoate polyprenyltransferase